MTDPQRSRIAHEHSEQRPRKARLWISGTDKAWRQGKKKKSVSSSCQTIGDTRWRTEEQANALRKWGRNCKNETVSSFAVAMANKDADFLTPSFGLAIWDDSCLRSGGDEFLSLSSSTIFTSDIYHQHISCPKFPGASTPRQASSFLVPEPKPKPYLQAETLSERCQPLSVIDKQR